MVLRITAFVALASKLCALIDKKCRTHSRILIFAKKRQTKGGLIRSTWSDRLPSDVGWPRLLVAPALRPALALGWPRLYGVVPALCPGSRLGWPRLSTDIGWPRLSPRVAPALPAPALPAPALRRVAQALRPALALGWPRLCEQWLPYASTDIGWPRLWPRLSEHRVAPALFLCVHRYRVAPALAPQI